jgi:hypothetical protein
MISLPPEVMQRALGQAGPAHDGRAVRFKPFFALSRSRSGALPSPQNPLKVLAFGDLEAQREELARLQRKDISDDLKLRIEELTSAIAMQNAAVENVRTLLEMLILGTTSQLSSYLRNAIYVGPLRTVPSRGFLYERSGRITRWADGLAAWDLLLADRLDLVERTNEWLRRLHAGCKIVVQQLSDTGADAEDIASGHVDKTVRRLLLETDDGSRVLPSEVGAGISQVIPIIVAALQRDSRLAMVEQPEIHVHPALQVGLGDLFIDAVTREGSRRLLLIETHSEHLILRLLRRIRETTEKELSEDAPPFSRDNIGVVYVESTPGGSRIRQLRVDEHGEFIDRWPKGFFEERAEELF